MDYDTGCYDSFTPGQIERMVGFAWGIHRVALHQESLACELSLCEWDLNGDGLVNVEDVMIMLSAWGNPYTVNELMLMLASVGCGALPFNQ
jgi:hypothetical protein